MAFIYLKLIDSLTSQATLTALSADAVYPATNLQSEPISNPWRTEEGDTAAQTVQIDFSSAKTVDLIALVNHNFSVNATITLNGGSSAAPNGSQFQTVISPTARTAWRAFTSQSWRYWLLTIDDPLNSDGYLECGLMMLGVKTTLARTQNWEFQLGRETINQVLETEYGVIDAGPNITQRMRFTASWKTTTLAERQDLEAFLSGLQRQRRGLFFSPDPDFGEGFYGRFMSDYTLVRETPNVLSVDDLEFLEDSPGRALRVPLFIADEVDAWDAGDSLASFTRASAAYYKNNAQALVGVLANTPRIHFHEAGVSGLLMEPAAENGFLHSESLDNAYWNKLGASITANDIAAPNAATTADKIVEDGSGGPHMVSVVFPAMADDTQQAFSFFAKADERSNIQILIGIKDGTAIVVEVDLADGSFSVVSGAATVATESYANNWWRILVVFDSASGGSGPQVEVRLHDGATEAYTGDGSSGLHVWGMQIEIDRPWPTSYIQSIGTEGTRSADAAFINAPIRPQAVSLYARSIEIGQKYNSDSVALALIGDSSGAHLRIGQAADDDAAHDNGSAEVQKTLSSSARAIGDVVESIAQVRGDGAVKLRRRINGGSPTESTFSSANALPANWGAPGPLRLGFAVDAAAAAVLIQRVVTLRGVVDDFSAFE